MHALREPVGAFAIHLSLLAEDGLNEQAKRRVGTMKANLRRMAEALDAINAAFGLEVESDGAAIPIAGKDGRGAV